MKKIFLALIFTIISISAFSQQNSINGVVKDNGTLTSNFENITGTVTDSFGMPLIGVNVIVKGTKTGTQTNTEGYYTIKAKKGNVLVLSFIGMQTEELTIEDKTVIDVILKESTEALKEVVVNAEKISRKERAESHATINISNERISKMGYYDNLGDFFRDIGAFRVRGQTMFSSGDVPLYVIDGVPVNMNRGRIEDLINFNDIESVKITRGVKGFYRYGKQGMFGTIEITTKFQSKSKKDLAKNREAHKYKGNLIVEGSDIETPYINELSKANSVEEAYTIYLKQKDQYGHLPTYYFDVYNYFKKWNNRNYELKILFNDVITDRDNPEQLKALAYLLEATNEYQLAINIYNQVLKLFPEDLQSYRDLALVYKDIGLVQESTAILNNLSVDEKNINNSILQFSSLDDILRNDAVVSGNGEVGAYDVRIVADWNRYDANINLQVIDPTHEICYYENPTTEQGGKLAQNMSQGYGPEEFTLTNAKKGSYYVMVNYSINSEDEKDVPIFLKVSMFKNYGKPTETKDIKVVCLTKPQDGLIVARLEL